MSKEAPVNRLNSTDKISYLATVISIIAADRRFDQEELERLYSLFSLAEAADSVRLGLLNQYIEKGQLSASPDFLNRLLLNNNTKMSLAKDMLMVQEMSSNTPTLKLVRKYLEKIKLSDEQVNVIQRFIAIENSILTAMGAGKEWIADENSIKELTARAAAVGVPLATLSYAGIAGFSAVGITSGLATIGSMSGLLVLGLNPMTAGIGALILGGVAVKKIADFALSSEDNEHRELQKALAKAQHSAYRAMNYDLENISKFKKREILLFPRLLRRHALRAGLKRTSTSITNSNQ